MVAKWHAGKRILVLEPLFTLVAQWFSFLKGPVGSVAWKVSLSVME